MINVFIFALLTAFSSAAHGAGDFLEAYPRIKWIATKGFIVALHVVLAFLLCGWIYAPFALAWWALFRRGKHAEAELDYLSGKGSLDAVRIAYFWPFGDAAALIVKRCKTRRQQEFALGIASGVFWGNVCLVLQKTLEYYM